MSSSSPPGEQNSPQSSHESSATGTHQESPQQEESILMDVLNQLDRERSQQEELEAQIRKMTGEREVFVSLQEELIQNLESNRSSVIKAETEDDHEITRRLFLDMETQVKEYRSLLDELTMGKPAIEAAADATSELTLGKRPASWQPTNTSTLPQYVVRLLEVVPWTPEAQEHVFARENIFEWQFYDVHEQQWTSNLRHFPLFFRSLSVVGPDDGKEIADGIKDKDRGLLLFGAGGRKNNPAAPSQQGVLTNEQMTRILNLENGYPPPDDGGTWEWIGGWRLANHVSTHNGSSELLDSCDEDGWSYAQEAEQFIVNPAEWVWDDRGDSEETKLDGNKVDYRRNLRRRMWTRKRVLVDYPLASESTKQFLKLLADNARLTAETLTLSDQLIVTKSALTESEDLLMRETSEAWAEITRLREELRAKDELIRLTGVDVVSMPTADCSSGNRVHDLIAKDDHVKEIWTWIGNVSGLRRIQL